MIHNKKVLEMVINSISSRHKSVMAQLRYLGIKTSVDEFLFPQIQEVCDAESLPYDELVAYRLKYFNQARDENNAPAQEPTEEGWDASEPIWKELEKTESYAVIKKWIPVCVKRFVIGTCTSAKKIEGQHLPLVKRGCKGTIIDPKASMFLPEIWQKRLNKTPPNALTVIFNNYMYFVDPKELNKLKYNSQQALF